MILIPRAGSSWAGQPAYRMHLAATHLSINDRDSNKHKCFHSSRGHFPLFKYYLPTLPIS